MKKGITMDNPLLEVEPGRERRSGSVVARVAVDPRLGLALYRGDGTSLRVRHGYAPCVPARRLVVRRCPVCGNPFDQEVPDGQDVAALEARCRTCLVG